MLHTNQIWNPRLGTHGLLECIYILGSMIRSEATRWTREILIVGEVDIWLIYAWKQLGRKGWGDDQSGVPNKS